MNSSEFINYVMDVYSDVEVRVVEAIRKRLAEGGSSPKWAEEKLGEIHHLFLDLRRVSRVPPSFYTEIGDQVRDQWRSGASRAAKEIKSSLERVVFSLNVDEKTYRALQRGEAVTSVTATPGTRFPAYVKEGEDILITTSREYRRMGVKPSVVYLKDRGEYIINNPQAISLGRPGDPVISPVGANVRELIQKTLQTTRLTRFQILRSAEDVYRKVIADVVSRTATGGATWSEAIQKSLERFIEEGVVGFIDRRGRRWSMRAYSTMAVRSALIQSSMEGYVSTAILNGMTLFRVSDHPAECDLCRPWEGKILSTGGDPSLPSLEDAKAAGLFHPQCEHRLNVVTRFDEDRPPDFGASLEERKLLYELDQKYKSLSNQAHHLRLKVAACVDEERKKRFRKRLQEVYKRRREALREYQDLEKKVLKE